MDPAPRRSLAWASISRKSFKVGKRRSLKSSRDESLTASLAGRYDIISWDPRGVNLTSPAPHCFSSENKAQLFQRDQEALGLLYENTPRSLASIPYSNLSLPISDQELAWARKLDGFNLAEDENCGRHGDQDLLQHLSTAVAARDMRFLMHALGEEVVNYYGLSYGTILGATFAASGLVRGEAQREGLTFSSMQAMYPDLVGHFVLDGVSDSIEYSQNLWNWGRSAMDHTSKVSFACALAMTSLTCSRPTDAGRLFEHLRQSRAFSLCIFRSQLDPLFSAHPPHRPSPAASPKPSARLARARRRNRHYLCHSAHHFPRALQPHRLAFSRASPRRR